MTTKTLLLAMAFGLFISAFSQKPSMELSFTAKNNDQYVPLDSILIENLTQGGDTILYAPDTLLLLEYITGVHEKDLIGNTISISQNYPNPFNEKTSFNLIIPKKEYIKITVRDILSRELAYYENVLNNGNHSFTFYSGNETNYLLTVSGKQNIKTIKMLKTNNISLNSGKCKIIYNGSNDNMNNYKTFHNINSFEFSLGDELQFTGYATTFDNIAGGAIITDIPQANTDYEFDIIKGIRCPSTPIVEDIDGNIYNTVQIGNQCWMKENLKTTTYKNGSQIPIVTDNTEWENLISGAYTWYDNDINWKDVYGGMYNWYAAVDENGLCPVGWHVPSDNEWTELSDYIGGVGTPHGKELKSCKQLNSSLGGYCEVSEHPRWNENSVFYGTDNYGFSCLPGSTRSSTGEFDLIGEIGGWWSTTEYSANNVWFRFLLYNYPGFLGNYGYKQNGFSIRCLKD